VSAVSEPFALDLQKLFPFSLDQFQLDAIAALNQGHSVVVCAPTGSGKTLIAEYAIYRALARRRRVFYTTPLKALSNQKLRDFREQFGRDQVGLLTGDVSINRDAPIVVMTTEIFRNMLYGTPIGEVGTSLADVEVVVLDECHYMNDSQRGTVWEESIIYCPAEIQLVALSATVANSDQLTDWLNQVHGKTQLIYSSYRPVPLRFHFCNTKGLFPLLDDEQTRINPRLKPKRSSPRKSAHGSGVSREEVPSLAAVLSQLRKRDMLPAIYFIFSRKGCDRAVADLGDLTLVNEVEAATLAQQIDEFLDRHPEAGRIGQVEPLYRGVAAHHAGILPAWKGLVEELFQQGLVKVVFATETLAAGINMPARTTVISTLSKRTDRGHRLLNPSEFLQMAGRAGRRGMDQQGHVITIQTRFEGAKEGAYLATAGADPLVSQFTPSYGMVLNLLQTHTIDETRDLIERSFGQYLATLHLRPQQSEIENLQAQVDQLRRYMVNVDPKVLATYQKIQERLREERRLLKTLQQQAGEVHTSDIAAALPFAIAGTILSLKGKHLPVSTPMPAVLITKAPSSGQFPYLVCLTQENFWCVVAVADVVGLHGEFPRLVEADRLAPPPDLLLKAGQQKEGDDQTAVLAVQIPTIAPTPAPEVEAQMQRVRACEAQLANHPARQWGNVNDLLKRQRRIQSLEETIEQRETALGRQSHRHWDEFLSLVKILQDFGCLEQQSSPMEANHVQNPPPYQDDTPALVLRPTLLGQSAAAIRGENELWLVLALTSRELDDLAPHELAAACAALVTEISRPDSWTDYELSTTVEDALMALRGIRRQLFQLQRRHQVVFPIWFELELIALIEQWALQVPWSELCRHTNLDEGDIVRLLRRTLDLLSQIPHVPHLPNKLCETARQAIDLMNRFPVNEMLEDD